MSSRRTILWIHGAAGFGIFHGGLTQLHKGGLMDIMVDIIGTQPPFGTQKSGAFLVVENPERWI
jgi:hypothetical protein